MSMPLETETKRVIRHTLRPRISTPVYLKTVPGATCVLRATDGGPGSCTGTLKCFAGDDGIICFLVRPSTEFEGVARFTIEASSDGKITHLPLEIRIAHQDSPEMPFPARPTTDDRWTKDTRPGLSRQDARTLSPKELRERGYPPRPDLTAPAAFDTWFKAVSSPATRVEPRLIENAGITHGGIQPVQATTQQPSGNWSGFLLQSPPVIAEPFTTVWGSWRVPHVLVGENNETDYSSIWVGIDGANNLQDLVQAGTEQDIYIYDPSAFTTLPPETGTLTASLVMTTYYAWTEFLPQQQFAQVISNLQVNPGDQMLVVVNIDGSKAYFVVQNLTTNLFVEVVTPYNGTVVPGVTAEWIVERPTVNNTLPDLTDYGQAVMDTAFATIGGTEVSYGGINLGAGATPSLESEQITMFDNQSRILSSAIPLSELSILFKWANFQ